MILTIHRGTHEIGGTCIQLSTDKTTILLDLGLPLKKDSPPIDLYGIKIDAVLVSHPHLDHYGLIDTISQSIPVYCGHLAKDLMGTTRLFTRKKALINKFIHFTAWKPFKIGDFTITPHLVDHSAVDAYAFLIEAEGKRLFYTGDFRAHGRKKKLFKNMINNPPKNIDVMFMEGTVLGGRGNIDFPDEIDVENKLFEVINNQKTISFLISSSQNIDRIVSAYRACIKTKKTLVVDLYTAWILEQLKIVTNNVPSLGPSWEHIKMYADRSYDQIMKNNPSVFGGFRQKAYQYRVRPEEMLSDPAQYLYLIKMSKASIIKRYKTGPHRVNIVYSQWQGYLDDPAYVSRGTKEIAAYRKDKDVNFIYAHTSGHATEKDLTKFARAINAKMVVPVHTNEPSLMAHVAANTIYTRDSMMLYL